MCASLCCRFVFNMRTVLHEHAKVTSCQSGQYLYRYQYFTKCSNQRETSILTLFPTVLKLTGFMHKTPCDDTARFAISLMCRCASFRHVRTVASFAKVRRDRVKSGVGAMLVIYYIDSVQSPHTRHRRRRRLPLHAGERQRGWHNGREPSVLWT